MHSIVVFFPLNNSFFKSFFDYFYLYLLSIINQRFTRNQFILLYGIM